jgi:hypothetical protein
MKMKVKKFKVIYDSVNGHAVPDSKATTFVEQCIATMHKDGLIKVTVGSAIVLSAIRKKIISNELDVNEVELFFKIDNEDVKVNIDKYGVIDKIPNVFDNCFDLI